MKELNLQKQCMLEAGKRKLLCYHFEAVNTQLPNGRFVRSGVPVGYPDLTIINKANGKVMFAELKVGYNQASKEQEKFLKLLPNAYLIRDVEDFIEKIHTIL